MIVEDEPFVQRALSRALRRPGIVIETARDTDEALLRVAARVPALVVADHGLPGRSGVDLLMEIRRRNPAVRRALVSGRHDYDFARDAVNRAGLDYLIPKPWEPADIEALAALALAPEAASPMPPPPAASDLHLLVSSLDDCDDVAELSSCLGAVLARRIALRELWWIDPHEELLHSRAGGLLPLDERPLSSLDAGTAALVASACAASGPRVLDGEIAGATGEAVKLALLAFPLRCGDRLLGVLGLLVLRADAAPQALVSGLTQLAQPLAGAVERVMLRAEARQLRSDLRQAGELSSLGHLAAAMVHEIRNPLASMAQALKRLRGNLVLGREDQTLIAILLEEVERVNRVATDFLAMSKPSVSGFARTSIPELAQGALTLLRRDPRFAHDIELETVFDPDLPQVRLDADKMRQVLWNLLLNATQALPRGGRIALHARAERDAGRDGVCIEVRDTGPGIPAAQRERSFLAFETTRPDGTGLGLALARHSVQLHGGWIRIDEAPGGGACLRLWLPAAGPRVLSGAAESEETAGEDGD